MRELDEFLSKAVELKSPSAEKDVKVPATRSCTIFEERQPLYIEYDWPFSTPRMALTRSPITIDLQRLVKNYDLSALEHGGEARQLLGDLTRDINQYRAKCHQPLTELKEAELIYYLNFSDLVSQHFENNSTPLVYDCGVSDKFRFEFLNQLLLLLTYYSSRALALNADNEPDVPRRKELSRERARLFHLCTEVLSELQKSIKSSPSMAGKIVYQHAPKSLGMDPVTGTVVVSGGQDQEPPLAMDHFILNHLGGEASVKARLHLCTAKKNEAFYDVLAVGQALSKDSDGKLRANLMGRIALIEQAYLEAAKYAQDSPLNEALYHHARFMAHYWLCRAHYLVGKHDSQGLLTALGKNQESQAELERAQEVLARFMFITERAIEMEKDQLMMNRLAPGLSALYNNMLADIQGLTEAFDKEIYERRNLREKVMDLSLPLMSERPLEQNLFAETRKTLFRPYYEQNPTFAQCRQLLRAMLERPPPKQAGQALQQQKPLKRKKLKAMDRATKLGILRERQAWLEYLLDQFSAPGHQFVTPEDLYEKLKAEYAVTQRGIEQVRNHQ